jgi:hypothetical protein
VRGGSKEWGIYPTTKLQELAQWSPFEIPLYFTAFFFLRLTN